MHGEGINIPRIRQKGRQPLIKCAISCLQFVLFSPCYVFMSFYAFCIFYLFEIDKGVSLAPTYSSIVIRKSDLRSSLRTERWLSFFYPFFARYVFTEQKSFKALDHLNDLLILLKREKRLRCWTINDLLFFESSDKFTC